MHHLLAAFAVLVGVLFALTALFAAGANTGTYKKGKWFDTGGIIIWIFLLCCIPFALR